MKLIIKNLIGAAVVAAVSFFAAITQTAAAATANVAVGPGGDIFSPNSTTISVNDSVIWTWSGTFHSTTSGTNDVHADDNGLPGGLWDSGVIESTPHSFTNTFPAAGVFSYYCSIHFSIGMTGTVFVVGASAPPTLSITNPLNGTVFAAPASLNIQAGVTNGSGNVTNVQFLSGNTKIASENSGPFSASAANLAAGNYTFSAIALDNNGLSATNTVAVSIVTPVTVALTNVFKLSGPNFQLSYPANIGLNYVVQRSTNLISWISLSTNTASSNPVVYVDLTASNTPNFYRVGRLPNP
jgi:plastocyanin